jgi:hypothetical protein
MLEKIAWGFSKVALAAAQDQRRPQGLRAALRAWGTLWFRLALFCEGRALAAVCEARPKRATPPSWQARLARLARHGLGRIGWPWLTGTPEVVPLVQAWSLPNLPVWQKLGLGPVWAVRCPFCRKFHTHLPGEGMRQAACSLGTTTAAYALGYAGELPRVLHEAFRASVGEAWPKVLLEWPRPEAQPAMLAAA